MSFFDSLTTMIQAPPTMVLSAPQQAALDLNTMDGITAATGEIMGGISHAQFGDQAKASADFQAEQLRQNAGQAQASAQRSAFDVSRQTDYANSRALAVAAASGGGASDPTVVNLIARNAGEGAYRQATALYGGDEKARLFNMQADAKEFEGANTQANSNQVAGSQFFKATSTLLGSEAKNASLLARFGAGGPNLNPNSAS